MAVGDRYGEVFWEPLVSGIWHLVLRQASLALPRPLHLQRSIAPAGAGALAA